MLDQLEATTRLANKQLQELLDRGAGREQGKLPSNTEKAMAITLIGDLPVEITVSNGNSTIKRVGECKC